MGVRQLGDGGDVGQLQLRVGQDLEIDHFRVRTHCVFDIRQVEDLHAGGLDALGGQDIREHA